MRWGRRFIRVVPFIFIGLGLGMFLGMGLNKAIASFDHWYFPEFLSSVEPPSYPPPLLETPTSDSLDLQLIRQVNRLNFSPAFGWKLPMVYPIWDNRLSRYGLYGETFYCRPDNCLIDGKIAEYCINTLACVDRPGRPGAVFIVELIKDDYTPYTMTKRDEQTLIHELQHVACYPEFAHGECFQMGMKRKALDDVFQDIW